MIDDTPLRAHPDAQVVVAFSGGLDSTVLLHALAMRDDMRARGLRAVHVDHGLHPDAPRWAEHCARFCESLGVAYESVGVDATPRGEGPEGAARAARYAALRACMRSGDVVALAHHREDQAETFLLRALRASGPDGLGAMRPWRRFGHGWLWRPLLATPRDALRAHARDHGLAHVDDPGNADDGFDRNYLRLHVLPLLERRWPHAAAALAASARHAADAAGLLEQEDARLLDSLLHDPATLDAAGLQALDPARRARVLRRWIAGLGLPPLPAEGVARIDHDLLGARADALAAFRWSGARVRRWRGLLHAEWTTPALPADWSADWDGTRPLDLPDGGRLALEPARALPEPVTVRPRAGGERIRLPARAHRHSLKHALQERDVPAWERDHLPLLFAPDGELAAAGDVAFSARFDAWLAAAGSRLVWTRPSPSRR